MTQVQEISRLVDSYRDWVKDRTVVRSVHADWVEITTPFVDRHNDHLQIYVKSEGDKFVLSDDGNTIRDLELSGCTIDTPKRKSILQTTLNGFGISLDGSTLKTFANHGNFSYRKHAILQAILAVNDLFHLASANVRSLFREDVEAWLQMNEIRFVPNVQLAGKSGYQHYFDFAIPRSKNASERIVRAISNPNKDTALNFITAWNDTSQQRADDAKAVAILNDNEKPIGEPVLAALQQYDIRTVRWSERSTGIELLAA